MRRTPVLTTAAAEQRWTRRWVDAAIREGDLVKLGVGVVAGADWLNENDPATVQLLAIRAALLRLKSPAVASHGAAAVLHGLSRMGRHSGQVRLTRSGTRYRRLDVDARLHTAGLPAHHVTTVAGISVTTPARTVVDLARMATFRSGVVVADSALRLGCSHRELETVLRDCRRWPGVRAARRVVEFARPEAETPLESVSRAFLAECGLPEPELQVELLDVNQDRRRVDFYWSASRTIGESDGLLKYDDPTALRREKLRQEALEQAGFTVVRWTWAELWQQPDVTERRIRLALARGAAAVAAA